MNNIKELREELCTLFTLLKDGKTDIRRATEMTNAAGKVMQSAKLQLEHARLRGDKPDMEFLRDK